MGLAKLPANHTETPPVRTPFPPQILKSMACERAQQYARNSVMIASAKAAERPEGKGEGRSGSTDT